jgi:hypothetical protein
MSFDPNTAALMDEGLSEGEARYFTSNGEDTSGLNLPADDGGYSSDVETSAPSTARPAGSSDLERQIQERDTRLNQLTSENAQFREHYARLDERLRLYREASEPPPDKPAAPPDRDSDPFGYMAYQDRRLNDLESRFDGYVTTVQQHQAERALKESYVSDARNFARQNPDFGHAYDFLMQNRDGELAAAGYSDPKQREQIIVGDERDIVARALTARKSPAQIIYGLAKARGFNGGGQVGGGAQPSAGGASRRGAPAPQAPQADISRIVSMRDVDFARWEASLNPAQRKQLATIMGA